MEGSYDIHLMVAYEEGVGNCEVFDQCERAVVGYEEERLYMEGDEWEALNGEVLNDEVLNDEARMEA